MSDFENEPAPVTPSPLPKSVHNPFTVDELRATLKPPTLSEQGHRMRAFINLMFTVAKAQPGVPADKDVAINCQLTFRDGGGQFGGMLAQTEVPGILRFTAPVGDGKGGTHANLMIDQYLCVEDIVRFAVVREVEQRTAKIWTPGS